MKLHRMAWIALVVAALVAAVLPLQADGKYKLVDRWQNPAEHRTFKKFIIIGISDVKEARNQFENNFVSQLRGRNIAATASYTIVPSLVGIDDAERDKILRAVEEQHIDGAITVRAVPLVDMTEEQWIAGWTKQIEGPGTLRELIEETLPLSGERAGKYGVELTVWDVEDRKRVWAGRTNVMGRGDLKKGIPEFVRGVTNVLVYVDLV
jgi:hypothetical protein